MTDSFSPLDPGALDRSLVDLARSLESAEGSITVLAESASAAIAEKLPVRRVAIWWIEAAENRLWCGAGHDLAEGRRGRGARLSTEDVRAVLDHLRDAESLVIDGAEGPSEVEKLLPRAPDSIGGKVLVLPIGFGRQPRGLLALEGEGAEPFGERDLLFLRATTHLLATAGRSASPPPVPRDFEEIERRLQRTSEMLQLVLDTIPVRVFWKDRECTYLGCNAHFARDAGRDDPAQMIGLDDWQMTWADQAELYRSDDRHVMETGEVRLQYEEPQTTPDGSMIWLRTSKIPLRNEEGSIFGVLGTYEDITERKELETTLRNQSEILSSVLRDMGDAVVIVDHEGKLLRQNREAARMLGSERIGDDPVGWAKRTGWCRDESGEALPADLQPLPRALRGEAVDRLEFCLRREASDEGRWISASARPLRDAEGRLRGAALLLRDITLRRRAEVTLRTMNDDLERRVREKTRELEDAQGQLLQAQRIESIGHLAAGLAHEINTPVQYVTSNVGFLQDAFTDLLGSFEVHVEQPESAEALGEADGLSYLRAEIPAAIEQCQEGLELIAGIVRAMKIFSPGEGRERKAIDLNEAIRSTSIVSQHAWKEVAEVRLDLDPDLAPVACHPAELNQALLNLLLNAAEAIAKTPRESDAAKGTIRIATRCVEDEVEIVVEDDGGGIPDEVRPKIFDPFFTTKAPGDGTGQGLAMVHSIIVRQHAGTIAIESAPGPGTRVVLRIPRQVDRSAA